MATTAAAIASRGGTGVRPGSGPTRYLDHGRTVKIEPDLTWYDSDGKPVAVIDAKYKTLTAGKRGPNADIYQLTAYCTALGLREGHLIYAKGDTASHAVTIVGADITIYCHALDLTTPPAELLASIDTLVETMRARRDWRPSHVRTASSPWVHAVAGQGASPHRRFRYLGVRCSRDGDRDE